MEQLDLTSPLAYAARVEQSVEVSTYRVVSIYFDWEAPLIVVRVRDERNVIVSATYENATATTLMTQLNKLDLSTQSLHKRILNRLVADGKLPAGTVTGSPD